MRPVSREIMNHRIGLGGDHHIDLLKKHLGVEKLELILLNSVGEYITLLIPPDPSSSRLTRGRITAVLAALVVAFLGFAMVFHPGIVLDHFFR